MRALIADIVVSENSIVLSWADDDEDENEEEEDGYSELKRRSPKTIYPAQADFFEGRRNSITLPRCCGGSHLIRVENLVGT